MNPSPTTEQKIVKATHNPESEILGPMIRVTMTAATTNWERPVPGLFSCLVALTFT